MFRLVASVILLAVSNMLMGQGMTSRDTLISDFKTFVKYLEATHPDPYSGFGGKVSFHQKAYDIEKQLRERDYTRGEFRMLAQAFISPLEDGHTYVMGKVGTGKTQHFLPITLKIIPDNIIIGGIPDSLQSFLGGKLKAVNGMPIEKLLEKISQQIACENLYGQYSVLVNDFPAYSFLNRFIPDLGQTITLDVELLNGSADKLILPFVNRKTGEQTKQAMLPSWEKLDGMDFISFRFLDKSKQIMYFRLQSIMAREAYMFMREKGWDNLTNRVKDLYEMVLKKEMPQDIDQAIAGIPSLSEQFTKMLSEMKKNKSEYLIIDLRDNGGGFTPITLPTLYQLYGDCYLQTDMGTRFYRLMSPLYMKKINTTLEEYNKQHNTSIEFGEYLFDNEPEQTIVPEQLRENFINQTLGDAAQYISHLNGKPFYSPEKVFVITNAGTFSAAFHYTFYLWKMGAKVVGIPSSQAPNTFMEQTLFELPLTGIQGSISNSAQYFLPSTDKCAKTFYPDFIPTYEDYKKHNFDRQTELLYLLEMIGAK